MMMKKIGFRLRTWMTFTMMRKDITMMDLTIENGCEVEHPRDHKGYTWIPMDAQAKKERKWIPM